MHLQAQQAKELVWTVAPRFELETYTLDMEVTIPQTERSTLTVVNVQEQDMLSCSVIALRSSDGLVPSCVITYSQTSASERNDGKQSLAASLTVQACVSNPDIE